MNIAFYAPMKSPNHPHPSGDRRIGRLFVQAFERGGHRVEVMSELRSWEGHGDQKAQADIRNRGVEEAKALIAEIRTRPESEKPVLWFSYHLYHKAPDWIGPQVASEMGIPYVVAEASYAPKQKDGDWQAGLEQVEHALDQAAAIICLNPRDIPALERLAGSAGKIHRLEPFIDTHGIDPNKRPALRTELAGQYTLGIDTPWLICVAMMRDDAKLNSYALLARSLQDIKSAFQLLIIGDGVARHKVEELFVKFPESRIRLAGQLDQAATLEAMTASDIFVWPAVNEAIGMAILEAQACGLPVVAGASGAISEIVSDGISGILCEPEDTDAFTVAIERLLGDPGLRGKFSRAAGSKIKRTHTLSAAVQKIDQILQPLLR